LETAFSARAADGCRRRTPENKTDNRMLRTVFMMIGWVR
jgi:hypothetical protein